MGQDKDSLISEAKDEHVSKAKRNLFIASHQQADVWPLPGKQGLSMLNGYLGRQTPTPQTLLLAPFLELLFLGMVSYGMKHPFGQFRFVSLPVSATIFLPIPSLQPTNCRSRVGKRGILNAVQELLSHSQNTSALSTPKAWYRLL